MIGNDLIYLPDWPQRPADRLERYRQKTFLPQEKLYLQKSQDVFFTEALLWSAKEAAYKIWSRHSERRLYNPKNFSIQLPDENSSINEIKYTASTLNDLKPLYFTIITQVRYNYLFTCATIAGKTLNRESFNSLTFKEKQRDLSYRGQRWPVQKTELKAPYLLVRGQVIPVSLSHHGQAYWYIWPT